VKPWIREIPNAGIAAGRQIGEGNLMQADSLSGEEPVIESVVPNRNVIKFGKRWMSLYSFAKENSLFSQMMPFCGTIVATPTRPNRLVPNR